MFIENDSSKEGFWFLKDKTPNWPIQSRPVPETLELWRIKILCHVGVFFLMSDCMYISGLSDS